MGKVETSLGNNLVNVLLSRCRKCANCRVVGHTASNLLIAMGKANREGKSCAEDARIIWNRTLEENPCQSPEQIV